MPLAAIGAILLWFGWFGFNRGSVLSANPGLIAYVIVTTSLAAAADGIATIFVAWIVTKKPDLSMALNGILAGLVGITAGAHPRRSDRGWSGWNDRRLRDHHVGSDQD